MSQSSVDPVVQCAAAVAAEVCEVFAGSARLAYALKQEGFTVLAIDHAGNKDRPLVPTLNLDLVKKSEQELFWGMVSEHKLKYVHFAPPCGTATRAREIRRSNGPDPKPLRSDQYPDGLPSLTGAAKDKVDSANELYQFVSAAVVKLTQNCIAWSIENPERSYMWSTS
eukprot:5929090-Karenia_brevis.AAC.1